MSPDMSVNAMVNSFIYIVKGSRVLHRKCGVDWRILRFAKESYASSYVLTMANLRSYFSERRTRYNDPVRDWFNHRHRITVATLSEALKFADEFQQGLIEPIIDVDAMIAADRFVKGETCPPWLKSLSASERASLLRKAS